MDEQVAQYFSLYSWLLSTIAYLFAQEKELAGQEVAFVVLEMESDALVVVVGGVFADDVRVQLHLTVRLRHLKRLVIAFRHHQEFDGRTVIV